MTDKIDIESALRDALPTHQAPASLREWARKQIDAADADSRDAGDLTATPRSRVSTRALRSLYAAGMLVAVALGWGASASFRARNIEADEHSALVAELVDMHVRSLMADHLTDVQSSDRHTVKPWFAGKADFAPRVPELSARGFPLLGGRIEYVGGHTTVALVYGRRRHILNLFVWPASVHELDPESSSYHGYSLAHWVSGGFSYWVVSDAASAELDAFRAAYEASDGP